MKLMPLYRRNAQYTQAYNYSSYSGYALSLNSLHVRYICRNCKCHKAK